ncbi:MAG TPA: SnoaL-like domain-containing protein [Puia sp.]|nr:SnoaL-like domain-containing protein [Puia sp.]
MKTEQIAKRLAELCTKGEIETAQKELFSKDAISIEPQGTPDFPRETKGLEAIIEKGHRFESMTEKVYGITTSEPLVTGNSFALKLSMDMTMKGKKREKMEELCVYNVKDDKIVSEQFFM